MRLILTSGGVIISIHKIKLPLPEYFSANSVNIYLITDEPVTLIDTGAFYHNSVETLKTSLREHNLQLSDIKRILLTHGHVDHCGVAGLLQEKYNTEVFIHERDKLKISLSNNEKLEFRNNTFGKLIERLGFNKKIINGLNEFFTEFFKYGSVVKELTLLANEKTVEFENFNLKVIHFPGHTAGSIGFEIPGYVLISGDAILENTFVTPVLEFRENGILHNNFSSYIKSLEKIKKYKNYKLLPGHGAGNFNIIERSVTIEKYIDNLTEEIMLKYNKSLTIKENFENIYDNKVNLRNFYFYFSNNR